MKQSTIKRMTEEPGGLKEHLEGRNAEIKRCHAEIARLTAENKILYEGITPENGGAIAAIERLTVERDALRALVAELADELESEVEGHYHAIKDHPAMMPKYERDMEPVKRARAALNEQIASPKEGQ